MEQDLFDDLMHSLDEALAYTLGDKTKGRSHFVAMSDDELQKKQLLWHKIDCLSDYNRDRVITYVEELLRA